MRILRWIGIILGSLLVIALIFAGATYFIGGRAFASTTTPTAARTLTVPKDAAAVARGDHIVKHVSLCVDCHGDHLEGTDFFSDSLMGAIPAPNLTSGKGGIGGAGMTDAMWINAITDGIGHDGRKLLIMPVEHYHTMTDADLGAVIAYLKQVPPQDNELPQRTGGPLGRMLVALGVIPFESDIAAKLPAHVNISPAVNPEYGAYMIDISGCRSCHGENLAGGTDPNVPTGPNITTAEVRNWSEDQFVNFLRTGTLPGGGGISDDMPWKNYAGMDEIEMKAIFAYLQTTDTLPTN